jgi:hypothetical protein
MKIYEVSGRFCVDPKITVTCRVLVKLYTLGGVWPISNLLVASNNKATDLRERLTRHLRETSV